MCSSDLFGCGHSQQVKRNALRRLRSDAGEATELVDQILDWRAVHPLFAAAEESAQATQGTKVHAP